MQLLYPPSSEFQKTPHQWLSLSDAFTDHQPIPSIVAVHGLDGDAINTWTHPKSKAFWLKDFLPKKIPDARIMTFGYNAAAAFGRSTAEVIDHAKSLLTSLVDKREELEVRNLKDGIVNEILKRY